MQAYRTETHIADDHHLNLRLPDSFPAGTVEVIVLTEKSLPQSAADRFASLLDFHHWLQTQAPTGRTAAEIDQQIAEERASWE